jgi:hypothetical protein
LSQDLCLDAGATPGPGTLLYFRSCAEAGTPRQLWVYRSDLTLFYGGEPALNLCIQGSSVQQPQLQRCTGTGNGSTYPYSVGQQEQLWSYNDNGRFASAATDGNVTNSCIQPTTSAEGAQLTFFGCTYIAPPAGDFQAFNPDPSVGAGKAGGNVSGVVGPPTDQYVNFEQFGRCLDVTAANVAETYLIAYPCKQAPLSSKVKWNQKWTWAPSSGEIGTMRTDAWSTATPSVSIGPYCLEAPDSGEFIVVKPCLTPIRCSSSGLPRGSSPARR